MLYQLSYSGAAEVLPFLRIADNTGAMPAHVSHLLFAEQAVRRIGVGGERLLAAAGNALRLGAQGPDLFYHALRTRPHGFRFGPLMHRTRFGSLVAAFLRHAPRSAESAAFAAGMATHAALDRCWHPYVVYHAGWVDPSQPATRRLRRCHAFLERVLDVLLAERLRGGLTRIDLLAGVRLGPELPAGLRAGLVAAIADVYPRSHDPATDPARVANAYHDALRFYAATDPRRPEFRRRAQETERREGAGRRRLALFHPAAVDRSVDWANEEHRRWRHPCDGSDASTASVFDLFEQALKEVEPMLTAVLSAAGRGAGFAAVAQAVGDHGLNLTRNGDRCAPSICDPLPVADLLDSQYRD